MIILLIFMLAVAVEAATEIIVSSALTEPLRRWIKTLVYPDTPSNTSLQYFLAMLDKLVNCGYCVSVWVSGFFALFAPYIITITVFNWLLFTLVLHRLSNLVHVVYELIRRGRVLSAELDVKVSQNSDLG